jgi:trans-2,3-dihydro-3-hydroxyanthranilate isomerase
MTPRRELAVTWVDVFTDRPFAGNPLAVVPEADGLDPELMQLVAAELGLSETVFVLEGATRLRIFTPRAEIPLAGHPVVGAALELARLGSIPSAGRTTFATGRGLVPVDVAGGVATMTQAEPALGPEMAVERAAALLGLEPEALVGGPAVCSTAIPQAFAQVRDRAALRRVRPDLAGIAAVEEADGLAAWCEEAPGRLAQRFFAPRLGVDEDAATGSAAGALGALRVFSGADPGRLTVAQGEEMGRPSSISVEVGGSRGAPGDVRVGGRCALVLEGRVAAGALSTR